MYRGMRGWRHPKPSHDANETRLATALQFDPFGSPAFISPSRTCSVSEGC
jgi:hypothetical protein